ncbi:MAG TPA: zf-TFIIB domain-containing protein [Chloroflexota bacterium]
MNCPVCQVPLNITERQGVEIDYCPRCRGVWLDRGELDKIIERAATQPFDRDPEEWRSPGREHERGYSYDYRKRKRKSFLDDLFDFG